MNGMQMQNKDNSWLINAIYLFLLMAIILFSFYSYAPLFHPKFDSDHAIHVLMAARSDYPWGIYYWGQNRLGSFLPEVSHYIIVWFKIHPLIAVSVVNHLFLITIFFLLQQLLKSKFAKLTLAFLLFFPLYTFNALLLVGHPYCSQLFTGIIGVILFFKSIHFLIRSDDFKSYKIWLYGLASVFFLGISVWISESSLLFPIFIFCCFIFYHQKRKQVFEILKNNINASAIYLFSLGVIAVFWYFKIRQFKNYYPSNDEYDRTFISDSKEIFQQGEWMLQKLFDNLIFAKEEYSTGLFTWSVIFLIGYFLFQKKKTENPLALSLMVTILVGCFALFLSTWNFRSQFEPRYFTLLYPFLILWLLIKLEDTDFRYYRLQFLPSFFLIAFTFLSNFSMLYPRQPGVMARFSGFAELEPGGVIGNYWQVYRACSISPFTLKGIAKEGDPLRNDFMLKEVMNEKIIYVIKTDFFEGEMPDTLVQYGYVLVKTGEEEKNIGGVILAKYAVK